MFTTFLLGLLFPSTAGSAHCPITPSGVIDAGPHIREYLPSAEAQYAAEHRPPFSTGSELPLPRALGVWGEDEGELGFDEVRGSPR